MQGLAPHGIIDHDIYRNKYEHLVIAIVLKYDILITTARFIRCVGASITLIGSRELALSGTAVILFSEYSIYRYILFVKYILYSGIYLFNFLYSCVIL